ncbi:MAG: isochorismatase family protein [Betaproteobacteria bacterium]
MTTTRRGEMGNARLARHGSLLLAVDIQERLAPHVEGSEALIERTRALMTAARRFGIACRLTEHCATQIGPVVAAVREGFTPDEIFNKTLFGATDHPAFVALLRATGAEHIVVAGMEAHVCVMQTVLGLLDEGFRVTAVADAIGARRARQADRQWALERMRAAGAILAGTETVLFEWTHSGNDPGFRAILQLVKNLP